MTDLDQLLRETFTAHEHLADPDRAVALARTPAPRSRPVAVTLAAITVAASVVIGTAYVVSRDGSDTITHPAQTPSVATSPTEVGDGIKVRAQNIANGLEAEKLANELLDSVPTPSGSTRLDHSPTAALDHAYGVPGTSDFTRSATAWWIVPASFAAVRDFYQSHAPTGMHLDGGSSSPLGISVSYLGTGSSSVEPPSLVIQLATAGDSVAVRADSFVNPRPARTAASYLGHDVTSVEVVALRNDTEARSVTITDHDEIARLVAMVNALPGLNRPTFIHGCLAVGIPFRYRLVFHTPDHNLAVEQQACEARFDVTLDGEPLPPSLGYTQDIRDWLNARRLG